MNYLRSATLLMSLCVLRCGEPSVHPWVHSEAFALTLPGGSQVDLQVGATTIAVLLVVGAQGDVTFTASPLPRFARITHDQLVMTPQSSDSGTFVITVTATAGDDSDSKELILVVDAPNTSPTLDLAMVHEASDDHYPAGEAGTCMLNLLVRGSPRDADSDKVRLEAEVVLSGAARTGVPTDVTDWALPSDANVFLELQGMAPHVAYEVYYRAADMRGGASEWQQRSGSLSCLNIGIRSFRRELVAGQTSTHTVDVLGVAPTSYVLSSPNLPPFVTIEGNVLSIDAPAVEAPTNYNFTLSLDANGETALRTTNLITVVPD